MPRRLNKSPEGQERKNSTTPLNSIEDSPAKKPRRTGKKNNADLLTRSDISQTVITRKNKKRKVSISNKHKRERSKADTTKTVHQNKQTSLEDISLRQIKVNIVLCEDCEIASLCKLPKVLPFSTPNPTILFVGESPNEVDYHTKDIFSGEIGDELNSIIKELGITNYALTTTIHCTPYTDSSLSELRAPTTQEIRNCSKHLKDLVITLNPKLIVALGKVAERATKSFSPVVGVISLSGILRSSHPQLEHDRAVLTIKEALNA